jgi:hypothetical protein
LRALEGYKIFSRGFATWPRDAPNLIINSSEKYVFLYDSSQIPHCKINLIKSFAV